MNESLKLLNETVLLFPEDAFYAYTCYPGGIKLQGKYNSATVLRAIECGFNRSDGMPNGYTEFIKDNIDLTFTD